MGNSGAGGGGGSKAKAKVMKINGEFFKLSAPTKAQDIIKDYPGHVLIDSDDFLRFKLRAQPLHLHSHLRPNKVYLLVQLPALPAPQDPPEPALRRTSSDGILGAGTPRPELLLENMSRARRWRRSNSDVPVLSGVDFSPPRRRSVKVVVPKAEVESIVEQSRDEVEAAEKIIELCMSVTREDGGGGDGVVRATGIQEYGAVDETTEEVSFSKYCISFHSLCSPYITHHRSKYKKLSEG